MLRAISDVAAVAMTTNQVDPTIRTIDIYQLLFKSTRTGEPIDSSKNLYQCCLNDFGIVLRYGVERCPMIYQNTALAGPARRRDHSVSYLIKVVVILDGGLLLVFRGVREASLDVPDENAGNIDHTIGHALGNLIHGKRLEHLGVTTYLAPFVQLLHCCQ